MLAAVVTSCKTDFTLKAKSNPEKLTKSRRRSSPVLNWGYLHLAKISTGGAARSTSDSVLCGNLQAKNVVWSPTALRFGHFYNGKVTRFYHSMYWPCIPLMKHQSDTSSWMYARELVFTLRCSWHQNRLSKWSSVNCYQQFGYPVQYRPILNAFGIELYVSQPFLNLSVLRPRVWWFDDLISFDVNEHPIRTFEHRRPYLRDVIEYLSYTERVLKNLTITGPWIRCI